MALYVHDIPNDKITKDMFSGNRIEFNGSFGVPGYRYLTGGISYMRGTEKVKVSGIGIHGGLTVDLNISKNGNGINVNHGFTKVK